MKVHAALLVSGLSAGLAWADTVQIRVTAQSLTGANGVSFSPVSFGFHDGTFDPWDAGAAPSPGTTVQFEIINGTQKARNYNTSQIYSFGPPPPQPQIIIGNW